MATDAFTIKFNTSNNCGTVTYIGVLLLHVMYSWSIPGVLLLSIPGVNLVSYCYLYLEYTRNLFVIYTWSIPGVLLLSYLEYTRSPTVIFTLSIPGVLLLSIPGVYL